MEGTSPPAKSRVSSFVLMIIFVTLALSLTALIAAIYVFNTYPEVAGYLILIGFLGAAMSAYVLFQTRKRLQALRIEIPPVKTTMECKKCGFKSVREFQRGDYVFKDLGPCQKCPDQKMIITAIYREVNEK